MTNMQRTVAVLALILAVLLGILLATTLLDSRGSAKPSVAASASPSSAVEASPSPSAAASPSDEASQSPSPSETPAPSPTPTPGPLAGIRFVTLALDATDDGAGTTRTISFTAQPGQVSVKLGTESGGNTTICLLAGTRQVACRTGASATLSDTAAGGAYQVTLRGDGSATPVVNVAITYPAVRPKVTISNARFDGTADAAHNGLQAVVTPRAKGYYHVTADWGGHPFLYEVDLIEQGGPGLKFITATTGATGVSQGFAVAPPNGWMIVLKNTETGAGATELTATFTWP